MHNSIDLTGLKVFAYHGVLESEKAYGQEFSIDCHLEVHTSDNDNIEEAVSYASVADLLVFETKQTRFNLIESLANHLSKKTLECNSRIQSVSVTINKPSAPIEHQFSNVSVTVTQNRS